MGPCSADPHPCWASWLLGLAGILLGVCSTEAVSSGAKDSGAHVSLEKVQGGSVVFRVTGGPEVHPEAQLQELSWGFGPELNYTVFLVVHSGAASLSWGGLQDKYKHRVCVLSTTSLQIQNLTREDSGQYRARGTLPGGREFTQVFHLTVHEPVPLPQILVQSLSVTSDWCNVTLDCRALGASEDLDGTWNRSDLSKELEHRGILGPDPKSWPLNVSLPLSQAGTNTSLTCVVSNHVDQKRATADLGEVCAHQTESHRPAIVGPLPRIMGAAVPVLLAVGAGLYLWKTRGKKKTVETGTGAGLEEDRHDPADDICYAQLSQLERQDRGNRGVSKQHLEEKNPLSTIYCEAGKPGQVMRIV